MPFTYMLECGDGSYYAGSTWDLVVRLEQHHSGKGGDYTRKRQPVRLVFAAEFDRIEDAYVLEKRIQGWSRSKRRALIEGRLNDLPRLSSKHGNVVRPVSNASPFGRRSSTRGVTCPPVW